MSILSDAQEAYAAYLNARVPFDDPDEQIMFNEDRTKARRALEIAWLNHTLIDNHFRRLQAEHDH